MVLKLHGIAFATCTKRVAVVLAELKVPYEFVDEKDFVAIKSPEYMEKQPKGQVPYLDDDGFILYESRAIARYIVARYPEQGPALIPSDPKANAIFEQAVSLEAFDFNPFAEGAMVEKVFKPIQGKSTDVAAYDAAIASLSGKLDVYDKILSKQKYLAGDEFTLADLFHLPYADLLRTSGSNIMEEKPNVARWFKDITSRESWVSVVEAAKTK